MANLTTDSNRAGTECELNKGDHPWIREKCFVNFGDAREVTAKEEAQIVGYMAAGTIKKHLPMDPAILQKIIAAAKTSKVIAVGHKKYF